VVVWLVALAGAEGRSNRVERGVDAADIDENTTSDSRCATLSCQWSGRR